MLNKNKAMVLVSMYLEEKERVRQEQAVLLGDKIKDLFDDLLGKIKNPLLKCTLSSDDYEAISIEMIDEFKVTEYGEVITGGMPVDVFKFIDILKYNIENAKKWNKEKNILPQDEITTISEYMEKIYDIVEKSLRSHSVSIMDIIKSNIDGFKYLEYNRYIHLLPNINNTVTDIVSYALITKDHKGFIPFMLTVKNWLQGEYFYDVNNEVIVTQDGRIIDIRYKSACILENIEQSDFEILIDDFKLKNDKKEKNPLCTILQ